jgi:hypothetical protein
MVVFFCLLRRSNSKKIWIVDLDNTIANTWPLRKKRYSDRRIYKEVIAFKGIVGFLNSKINLRDLFIILTARPYRHKKITKKWIEKCFSGQIRPSVFLVESPSKKLNYIKLAIRQSFEVTYIDDLSYNHENGDIRFYNEVLDQIYLLPIKYIGYEEILRFQE